MIAIGFIAGVTLTGMLAYWHTEGTAKAIPAFAASAVAVGALQIGEYLGCDFVSMAVGAGIGIGQFALFRLLRLAWTHYAKRARSTL